MLNSRSGYPYWPNKSAKPTISWSAESAYAECPRKWFYEYNHNLLPLAHGKKIRAEKPLLSLPMLTGKVVHDIIDTAIRHYKKTGEVPEIQLADARVVARQRLRQYHTFSQQWTKAVASNEDLPWVSDLAPIEPVFRGETLTPADGQRILATVEKCLVNFRKSPVYRRIMAYDPEHLVPQPQGTLPDGYQPVAIPWYWAEDSPVYASYDLLVVAPGETVVIDWKTGNRTKGEERVEQQLNYYAGFVVAQYGVSYEEIELVAAWIGDGTEFSSFEANPSFLRARSPRWSAWRNALRLRVLEAANDITLLDELFPMSTDVYRCKFCKYQSCPGFARHRSAKDPSLPGEKDTFDTFEEY